MKQIHLGFKNGHLYFLARCIGNKEIRVVVDTGAVSTFVFKDILIQKKRHDMEYKGVGTAKSKAVGTLVTDVFSAKAVWIDDTRLDYDAILGLDWMIEHHANINIMKLTLEYD